MNVVFGPVASRRFGLSLGIDLSPSEKSCNFDCLYCELTPAKQTTTISRPPSVQEVVDRLQQALNQYPDIDVITITANGEPTLYPYLDELIDRINNIKENKKLLILSNASTIYDPDIQKALQKIDIVKLSLDCATKRCFKRLDRPHKSVDLDKIIEGTKEFRQKFNALLIIEILVVRGINDNIEEFRALNEVLQQIKPDRIDIGTIDRPPAYRVEPVDYHTLFELSQTIENLPVAVVARKMNKAHPMSLTDQQIVDLLARRPLTQEDITTLFDQNTQNSFQKLLHNGVIKITKVGNVDFYKIA